LHYTTISHETKHFHDYILSPLGSYIIRIYFFIYAQIFALFYDLSHSNSELLVPIRYIKFNSSINKNLSDFIDTIYKYLNDSIYKLNYKGENLDVSSNGIFEALAILSQVYEVEESLGNEKANLFYKYIINKFPEHTKILSTIEKILSHLNNGKGTHYDTANTILFSSLCGDFTNQKEMLLPPVRLGLYLEALLKDIDSQTNYNLETIIKKYKLSSVADGIKNNLETNKQHYNTLKEILKRNSIYNTELSQQLLNAYKFFMCYNEELSNHFLISPETYLNPNNYKNRILENFPVPIIIEEYKGYTINVLIQTGIIKQNAFSPIIYQQATEDNISDKCWSILNNDYIMCLKKNKLLKMNLNAINVLYTSYAPLLFTLVNGIDSEYTLINPVLSNSVYNMANSCGTAIKEYFPENKLKKRKLAYKKYIDKKDYKSIKCIICNGFVGENGYMISKHKLYQKQCYKNDPNEKLLNYLFQNNYTSDCVCNKCYTKFKF